MSNDEEKLKLLLKEWELCQEDRNAYNHWAWQIGSIFIALSLAALWASIQAKGIAIFWFFIFSMSTLVIWLVFVLWRARFYIEIITGRLLDVEKELTKLVYGENKKKKLLHTLITCKDKKERPCYIAPPSMIGIFIFITVIVFVWLLMLHFEQLLPLSASLPTFIAIVFPIVIIQIDRWYRKRHEIKKRLKELCNN